MMADSRLSGEGWSASIDTAQGTFSIFHEDETLVAGASAAVFLTGGERLSSCGGFDSCEGVPGGYAFEKDCEKGKLLFRATSKHEALILEAGVRPPDVPLAVDSVLPLRVPPGGLLPAAKSTSSWRFYSHGFQCWTPSAALRRSRPGDYLVPSFFPKRLKPMLLNQSTPVSSNRGSFESEWLGGLADLDLGRSLVAGFTGVSRALSRISVSLPRNIDSCRMEARSLHEGKSVAPGDELWGEPLAVIPGDLSGKNLERYAELLAREQGVGEVRGAPTGWCSWYHYYTGITAGEVEKNLELLVGKYKALGTGLLQVDDGYSPAVGDWLETNDDFGAGMKPIADAIASRGILPGVWVAPFTVARRSRLFKEKPDWVVRNSKGKPVLAGLSPDWGGRFYGLDLTKPEVLDYLREVFTSLHSCGFRFFKIDFLATGLLEGERHDQGVTRAEAARKALSVIREAVGDSHIMAAGGPVLLGAGIFDSQRVSGDVAPAWHHWWQPLIRDRSTPGVRNSLLNTLERSYFSGRVFEGDPDCMMARSGDSKLSTDERRTLGSVMSVFGGSFLFSDDLSLWTGEETALMSRLLPHGKGTCSCPDIWRREVPRYLVSERHDPSTDYLLAVAVNWSPQKRDLLVPLGELGLAGGCHAYEFWTGEYMGIATGEVVCPKVPRHGCALLRLTPVAKEPALVGSDINASIGAVELEKFEQDEGKVTITLRVTSPRKARVLVAIPGAARGWCDDESVSVGRLRGSVFEVKADLEGQRRIEISYEERAGR